jgi:hypothetical protein
MLSWCSGCLPDTAKIKFRFFCPKPPSRIPRSVEVVSQNLILTMAVANTITTRGRLLERGGDVQTSSETLGRPQTDLRRVPPGLGRLASHEVPPGHGCRQANDRGQLGRVGPWIASGNRRGYREGSWANELWLPTSQ